ncbi:MAG: alpha/beta fold hydrolase [Pseudobdellovibrionaceae bacterium]
MAPTYPDIASKIVYKEMGKGPLLVLFHGFGGTPLHWQDVAESLSASYRVIVPNLSHIFINKEAYSFTEQVEILQSFIETNFTNEERVALAGMSFGGALTWGLTVRLPHKIKNAIYINPMPPAPAGLFALGLLRHMMRLPINTKSIYIFLNTPMGKMVLPWLAKMFRVEREEGNARIDQLKGRKLMFVSHIIARFNWIIKSEDWEWWRERLRHRSERADSFLIFDNTDPLFTKTTYEDFSYLIGCENICEVKGGGHLVVKTKPDRIAREIETYLHKKNASAAAS